MANNNNNSFAVRTDSNKVPVAGYNSAADVVLTAVQQLVKVSNTATTSNAGIVQVQHFPIAPITHYMDHSGNLTETYSITVTNASTNAVYYAGTIDPNAGTFTVYSDSGLTTPVTSTNVNYNHYYLAPVVGTLNADGTVTQQTSIMGSNANFSQEGNAPSTDTPYTANVKQWFTFANDDPTNNIQINFDATVGSAGTMTVHPGDVINGMPRAFTTLHVKAAAGTPAFRAWGV